MWALRAASICAVLALTYAALNLAHSKQAQTPIMSERKAITYSFKGYDEYEKQNATVTVIVKEDTGVESWKMNRMIPPTAHPPPLTLGAVDKLKALEGVIVEDAVEEV